MRLIDADEMLDNEAIAYMKAQNSKTISALTMQVNKAVHAKIQMLIADTPTVEAKPVVHCRDCCFFEVCKTSQWLGIDGYCSRGEKHD